MIVRVGFLVALLLVPNAYASRESCTPVSLQLEKFGPVRDQGIAGLCFAFESADLLTYRINTRISALDMALSYFQNTEHKKMSEVYENGGETPPTMAGAERIGLCRESEMPSDETILDPGKDTEGKIHRAFVRLEKLHWSGQAPFKIARTIFPNVTKADVDAAGRYATIKERLQYLQERNCKRRIPFPAVKLVNKALEDIKDKSGMGDLLATLDEQLTSENPVGIGFYSNDIYSLEERDDGHAVTIVGRRWNEAKSQCEYRIRDTFGEQCSAYKNGIECDGGYIWVDTAFLKKNLFEVEYLE